MPPKKAAAGKKATPATRNSGRATAKATAKSTAKVTKSTSKTTTKAAKGVTKATKATKATQPAAVANTSAKRGRPTKNTPAPAFKETAADPAKKDIKKAAPSRKRKAAENDTEDVQQTTDNEEKTTTPPKTRPTKRAKIAPHVAINDIPNKKLHVFVCGEGSSGELGLGSSKKAIDVKRPRLNANLSAETVGVVQIATGGMHVAALTFDNKILTWGVNDQGALGRDTTWSGGLVDMDDNKSDDSDDDDNDDAGLNPREATPTAIPADSFPEGIIFCQVAAADSATFALTDDGFVYGWGTFRSNEGVLGFTQDIKIQKTPMLLKGLKKIKQIACGSNHVLALDTNGNVFAWGSGQQNQLGRRVVERTKASALVPREFGLPKKNIESVECGDYHSFSIDKNGSVWAWGLNNYGETGIPDNAGEEDACVLKPEKVEGLEGRKMKHIKGGAHHSIGVTEDGDCLVWGRLDGAQMGMNIAAVDQDDIIRDEHGRPRILAKPTKVPNVNDAVYATCGSDHSIAITKLGKAYAWGFSTNYQTGLGTTDDIQEATLIDNTAVRGKKLNWAGAGGQYSVLTAIADEPMVNGVDQPVTNGVVDKPAANETKHQTKTIEKVDANGATKKTEKKKSTEKADGDEVMVNGVENGEHAG